MTHHNLPILLDRFTAVLEKRTGLKIKRTDALEIVAAAFGYHNSNELTAADKTGRFDIPKAKRVFNKNMITLQDPLCGEIFGLPYATIMQATNTRSMASVISPAGNLLRIDGLFNRNEDERSATRKPTAAEIAASSPLKDPKHPVMAEISDDNNSHTITLDISAYLAQTDDATIAEMSDAYWTACGATDRIADWEALENASDLNGMWEYMSAINKTQRDGIGYNVVVDEKQAMAWVRFHRPALFLSLLDADDETPLFTRTKMGNSVPAKDALTIISDACNILKTSPEHTKLLKRLHAMVEDADTQTPQWKWMPEHEPDEIPEEKRNNLLSELSRALLKKAGDPSRADTVEKAEDYDRHAILSEMVDALNSAEWPHQHQNTQK